MDASARLANYYEKLIERCNQNPSARPDNLPKRDRIIYYVISTRCEIDINGFDAVFDQLLSENELTFLIETLNELEATELAGLFESALKRLKAAGFFDEEGMCVSELDPSPSIGFLDDIEALILENDELWELDEKLAELIPTQAT